MGENKFQKNTPSTVDLHTHSNASLDAEKPITYILKKARENKTTILAVSDHNTLHGVNYFLDKRKIDRQSVMELIDLKTIFIPATEITCRVNSISNLKGNSSKIHILAYGLNRDENSPISKVLNIKHQNDKMVDHGLLDQAKHYFGLDIKEYEIMKYITEKKRANKGFNTFGKDDVVEFLKFSNYNIDKTDDELKDIIHNFSVTERLNLEVEDVIKLIHASGGIAVLAHPYTNLKRTSRAKELLQYLLSIGLDGIEMYYPFNTPACDQLVREVLVEHGSPVIYTGGSDYHDDDIKIPIPDRFIPFSPPTTDKVAQFMDKMSDIKESRKRGDEIVADYARLKQVNPKYIVKKYEKLNDEINSRNDLIL